MSLAHRTCAPKMPGCVMVWLAPVSRNSDGLSAVNNSNGTCDWAASTTPGSKFATAVPEVTIMATGARVALAHPRAKKAPPRSSWSTTAEACGCRATATTKGVDLEPAQITKLFTPSRTHSSTTNVAHSVLIFGSAAKVAISRPRGTDGASGNASVNCLIFRLISANSSAGLEPGTMPAPPYTCNSLPRLTRQERIATTSSEPCELRMPQGAAYNPRSQSSDSRMKSLAKSSGMPPTAGVGDMCSQKNCVSASGLMRWSSLPEAPDNLAMAW
mmetsp:Transcript_59259/g.180723  ORF Transcript_59259/g.180723 Transcript_59259/m.180723 type:complete len:272 (-) Transcript_59259:1165-1980(-)